MMVDVATGYKVRLFPDRWPAKINLGLILRWFLVQNRLEMKEGYLRFLDHTCCKTYG
jgi:hypothetical protein